MRQGFMDHLAVFLFMASPSQMQVGCGRTSRVMCVVTMSSCCVQHITFADNTLAQGQSGVGCSSMPVRDLMRCQSAGGDYSLPSLMSDSSCSTICPDLDRSFSLNISSPNSVLEDPPAVGSLFSSEHSDSQHSSVPPIGLQLRKSESFLDLINEHLQKGQ